MQSLKCRNFDISQRIRWFKVDSQIRRMLSLFYVVVVGVVNAWPLSLLATIKVVSMKFYMSYAAGNQLQVFRLSCKSDSRHLKFESLHLWRII